jgi:hypothetical protein
MKPVVMPKSTGRNHRVKNQLEKAWRSREKHMKVCKIPF